MIIRPATPMDASQIAELLNGVIRAGGTTAMETEVTVEGQAKTLHNKGANTCFYVAVEDETHQVIGFQYLVPHRKLAPNMASIATFARVGGVQRGIGSALFAQTRKAAVAMGYCVIDATIRADNTGGLAYYSKMGFSDHSVAKDVPLADGTPVDRISKRLKLG